MGATATATCVPTNPPDASARAARREESRPRGRSPRRVGRAYIPSRPHRHHRASAPAPARSHARVASGTATRQPARAPFRFRACARTHRAATGDTARKNEPDRVELARFVAAAWLAIQQNDWISLLVKQSYPPGPFSLRRRAAFVEAERPCVPRLRFGSAAMPPDCWFMIFAWKKMDRACICAAGLLPAAARATRASLFKHFVLLFSFLFEMRTVSVPTHIHQTGSDATAAARF